MKGIWISMTCLNTAMALLYKGLHGKVSSAFALSDYLGSTGSINLNFSTSFCNAGLP